MPKIIRRYNSTIHGNYRFAYLKYGLLTGLLMSLYVLVRHWIGCPSATPSDIGKDVVMIAAMLFFSYLYRRSLGDGMVTFKELALLGLGIGLVSALVFGLFVWLYCGIIYPEMTAFYAENFRNDETTAEGFASAQNPMMWAIFFGFVHTVVTSIIVAFFSALIFRTEKGERI